MDREVWAKRIARWRDSGLTANEFASEIGVNANTLKHWSWQLGVTEREGRKPQLARALQTPPQWVEVVAPAAAGGNVFEIVLAGGRVVRVPADFSDEALGRLLAVVDAG